MFDKMLNSYLGFARHLSFCLNLYGTNFPLGTIMNETIIASGCHLDAHGTGLPRYPQHVQARQTIDGRYTSVRCFTALDGLKVWRWLI
jgi:hypothetical protein